MNTNPKQTEIHRYHNTPLSENSSVGDYINDVDHSQTIELLKIKGKALKGQRTHNPEAEAGRKQQKGKDDQTRNDHLQRIYPEMYDKSIPLEKNQSKVSFKTGTLDAHGHQNKEYPSMSNLLDFQKGKLEPSPSFPKSRIQNRQSKQQQSVKIDRGLIFFDAKEPQKEEYSQIIKPNIDYSNPSTVRQIRASRRSKQKLEPIAHPHSIQVLRTSEFGHSNESGLISNPSLPPLRRSKLLKLSENTGQQLRSVHSSVPPYQVLDCLVTRNKSGLSRFAPQYSLLMAQDGSLTTALSCKKQSSCCTSSYAMFLGQGNRAILDSPEHIGTVSSSVIGSKFDFRCKQAGLLATVYYPFALSCMSTVRNVELYILSPGLNYEELEGAGQGRDLKELAEVGDNVKQSRIRKFVNRQPLWDNRNQCYKMDFRGKAPIASVKNMVIVQENEPTIETMILGKVTADSFNLSIRAPLSPKLALAIAISSCAFKLISQ